MNPHGEVSVVEFGALDSLRRGALREGLSFKETKNTDWYGLFLDGELIGCGGLIWLRKDHSAARLKAAYILPEWRGQHLYSLLVRVRVADAFADGAAYVMTITRHPHIFRAWGWVPEEGKTKTLCLTNPAA